MRQQHILISIEFFRYVLTTIKPDGEEKEIELTRKTTVTVDFLKPNPLGIVFIYSISNNTRGGENTFVRIQATAG